MPLGPVSSIKSLKNTKIKAKQPFSYFFRNFLLLTSKRVSYYTKLSKIGAILKELEKTKTLS